MKEGDMTEGEREVAARCREVATAESPVDAAGDFGSIRFARRGAGRLELCEIAFGRCGVVLSRAVFERIFVGRTR